MKTTLKNKKRPVIAFIGSLPPPIGGFTIILERLIARLKENGFDFIVYDLLNKRVIRQDGSNVKIKSCLWWLLKYVLFAREDLICCYYSDWRLRIAIGLMTLLRKKTLISIGGQSLNDSITNAGRLKRKMITFSLRRYSFVIAHNTVISELCRFLGVKAERLEIIPGFIPPVIKKEALDLIPQNIEDFMESHQPVISGGAFRITFYNGIDDYGIDMCIELCGNLKKYYPKTGFIFCLTEIGDENYFAIINRRITENDLDKNFLFIVQPLTEVYPIWQKSDIFVRPTASEGDSLALREALYVKTPAVASDVAPRPKGTVIFKNRDIEDFTARVKMVWENHNFYKAETEFADAGNGLDKTLEIFRGLTRKHR
jgi:glycosyltransferase involved in cell wall biosynthesis